MSIQSRRTFLKGALAATAVAPLILPSRSRAVPGPNSRVCMAFIGLGAQGRQLLRTMPWCDIQVVAVCDVDANRRDNALNMLRGFYAEHPEKGTMACEAYRDFREVLARPDVDAVCIATPDHWHAIITLAALKAGKDVYCEKPLTHNIHEAIEVMDAVRKHRRILQTGSMQRSMSEFRVAAELVRNGVIGKLKHVECTFGGAPRPCDLPEETPDPGLDWDLWLGPAPARPYHSILCPRGANHGFPDWRSYVEYGGGGNCDFGAHHLDCAHWGMDMDASGPVEIRPPEKPDDPFGAWLVYENGVTVTTLKRFEECSGVHFIGSDGEVWADRGYFRIKRGEESIKSQFQAEKQYLGDAKIRLIASKSHADDFLARIADRGRTVASEIEGGHTAIACHLLNLACIHRKTLKWNPKKYRFVDGTGEKAWLTRDYRKPWKV